MSLASPFSATPNGCDRAQTRCTIGGQQTRLARVHRIRHFHPRDSFSNRPAKPSSESSLDGSPERAVRAVLRNVLNL
jgi:hypothetical protein